MRVSERLSVSQLSAVRVRVKVRVRVRYPGGSESESGERQAVNRKFNE